MIIKIFIRKNENEKEEKRIFINTECFFLIPEAYIEHKYPSRIKTKENNC